MSDEAKLKVLPFKERIVERGRGCWNCKHWNNGASAQLNYQLRPDTRPGITRMGVADVNDAQFHREVGQVKQLGFSEDEAVKAVMAKRQMQANVPTIFDAWMKQGTIGLCPEGVTPDGTSVDFTHAQYLCHKWSGVEGASLATSGHALDKLPDELKDMYEPKATAETKPEPSETSEKKASE